MNSVLIKNINVVLENKVKQNDVLIQNSKIKKIGSVTSNSAGQIINGTGKYLFPGAIDPHVHLSLDLGPGRMSSDNFYTGTFAGLQGGVTSIYTFAHQEKPGETLLQAYQRRAKLADSSNNRCYFHSGIMTLTDDIETQIKDIVKKTNVRSFKIYLNSPAVNTEFLYRTFKTIAEVNAIALLHCEDAGIVEYLKHKYHNSGKQKAKYIPETRPGYCELFSLQQACFIANLFKTRLYIVHVSTAEGADYIKSCQKSGMNIHAETCPHYLLLTDKIYKKNNAYIYTCTPPLRKNKDTKVLWNMLKNGTIKHLATDHCPFTKKQKEKFKDSFINYVYGLPGIEIMPVLMISEMRKRKFPYSLISKLLSTNTAKLFGKYPDIGTIKKNSRADLFIYNPKPKQKLSFKNWHINCNFNQFENFPVNGVIETVIFNGKIKGTEG